MRDPRNPTEEEMAQPESLSEDARRALEDSLFDERIEEAAEEVADSDAEAAAGDLESLDDMEQPTVPDLGPGDQRPEPLAVAEPEPEPWAGVVPELEESEPDRSAIPGMGTQFDVGLGVPVDTDPLAQPELDLPVGTDMSLAARHSRWDRQGRQGERPGRRVSQGDIARAVSDDEGPPFPDEVDLDQARRGPPRADDAGPDLGLNGPQPDGGGMDLSEVTQTIKDQTQLLQQILETLAQISENTAGGANYGS